MTRGRLLPLLLLAAGAVPVMGQALGPVLVIEVRDSAEGAPLGYARGRLLAARRMAAADAGGRITLAAPAAPDTLLVSALGYAAWRRPVAAGETGRLTARLVAEATELPDVVVTTVGQREARGAELTVATQTIDQREISAQAATAVDQVVGELPGVQQGSGFPAGSHLFIRGLGESRVLLLVDGEPVGGPLLENRDLSRTSTLAVERIEVTKGPGSVAHGSDAIGGVINVVTAEPAGPLRLTGEARAGTGGRKEGSLALVRGGRIGVRLAGGWRQVDRVAGLDSAGSAFERVWDLRGTARTSVGGARLRVDGGYDRTRQRWPVAGGFNGFVDTWGANALAEAAFDQGSGTLRTRVSGSMFEYRYRQARGNEPIAGSGTPAQTERALRGLVAWTRPVGNHLLDLGVEGMVRDVEAPARITAGGADDREVDFFAQDGWELGAVFLNAGARLSHNSRWGTSLTPSLGAAWQVTPALRWRASVARGYRGPSFKELAWDFPNVQAGYVILGNADLTPERSWSYSTGLAWAPGGGWRFGADVYRNSITDLIDFSSRGVDPNGLLILTPRNLRSGRTEGVELEVRKVLGNWALGAGYDYLNARNQEEDLPLDRRARHSGRLRATRFLGFLPEGTFDLTARYTGKAPLVVTNLAGESEQVGHQEEFLTVDLQLAGRLLPGFGLQAGVDNLLDRQPANWPGQVGRRFYLGFRAEVAP